MWRNYWTVAVRALAKSKTYSIINIAGLAIGMAACIMILLYIRYEQSYDKWLPDVENTYQFQTWYESAGRRARTYFQMTSYITKDRIKKDFPQVERAVYFQDDRAGLPQGRRGDGDRGFLFTDDDFLKVVNLPLVAGTTLTAPQTAVITQSEAIKRFGTDQVLGRTLTVISPRQEARLQDHRRAQGPAEEFAHEGQRDHAARLSAPSTRTTRSS